MNTKKKVVMHCEKCKEKIIITTMLVKEGVKIDIPKCVCGYQETDPFKKFS